MQIKNALFVVLSLFIGSVSAQPTCGFNPWTTYHGTTLSNHPGVPAYLFATAHMAVDADGAPNAYHPQDSGLDYLANAGYPGSSWWDSVLVPDPHDAQHAYVQSTGEFAGYFVSKTSLQDRVKDATDPARYVDARSIPYLVFPGAFYRMSGTGRLGDLGFAVNLATGQQTPFVVADIGPSNADLGEVSIALAERLGGANVSPRTGTGMPGGKTLYVVFPYSSRSYPWPLSLDELERHAMTLVEQAGGIESILACHDTN